MAQLIISGTQTEPELVIFDKDGTLVDFRKTWLGLIEILLRELGTSAPMNPALRERIQDALGICIDRGEIDGYGPLAMGTFSECDALLTSCLYHEGLRWDRAQQIVSEAGQRVFRSDLRARSVHAAPGAITLLRTLKRKGILSAVATNDKMADALRDMELIGASQYIDFVIGADSVVHSKPAPDMVMKICDHLHVSPDKAILVGDTIMDGLLGRNSGVMLTIGVVGITSEENLREHMDIVVSSLEEIT
ncbi:MAG TPA: HAD family hydrolase [Deltaproteobacteria bacterium]|nr:HAD family hydrolase [Deltaproteobacteria bacterium]